MLPPLRSALSSSRVSSTSLLKSTSNRNLVFRSSTTSLHLLRNMSAAAAAAPAPMTKSTPPRHFLSIGDLSREELSSLVRSAAKAKKAIKSGDASSLHGPMLGKTVALMFSKRSTRTRVSTEAAVVHMGGHPMFLGKDDIQLGVCSPAIAPPQGFFWTDTNHRSMSHSTIPVVSSPP